MADDDEIRRRQLLYRAALTSAAGVAGLTTLGKIFLEGDDDTTDNPGNGTPSPTEPGNGTPTSPEPESPTPTDSEPTDNGTEEPTDNTPTNSDDSDNGGYRDPFVSSVNVGDLPQYKDLSEEFDIEATVSGYDLSHIELKYRLEQDETGRPSANFVELQRDEIDEDGFTEYTIEFDDYEHSKEEIVGFFAGAASDDGDNIGDREADVFLVF